MRSSLLSKLLLASASLLLCVLVAEGTFRLIGFDFEAARQRAHASYPIFYRQPRKPLGDVYFQRRGPASWTGRVLATGLRTDGGLDDAYTEEAEVTITYDGQGFRNPDDLEDWELVVVGDSFVEMGYLPHEDLFTTRLGGHLGARVKNVGASFSGPLTYVAYLAHFGAAPSTRHAVMVFFEGNDLPDAAREAQALRTFQATGRREYRHFEKQTSLLRAAYRLLRRLARGEWQHERLFRNAYFAASDGEQPVSVHYAPPRSDQVTDETRTLLDETFAAWARTARTQDLRPWLVYMPCKRRVLDGRLRFTEDAPQELVGWHPTDLPHLVQALAERHGIGFIDATPGLSEETRRGRLTYNPVWDTHLNRLGAEVVARTLADSLRKHLE